MPTPVMQSEPLSVEPDLMMGANPADAEQFLSEGEQERGSKSPTQKNDIENGNGEDKNMGDAYEERERPAAESSGWEKSPRENNGYNSSWQEPGESEERSRYRDEQGDAAGWGGEIDVKGTAPEQRGVEASERFTPGEGYIKEGNTRDNPEPTNILGVFGLSLYTTEENLMDLFSKYGKVEKVTLVYDKEEPKRSRGFGFVTMDGVESATKARNGTNGTTVEGRSIRVDYSITRRAHSPNPTSTGYTYDPSRRHNDRDRDRPPFSRNRLYDRPRNPAGPPPSRGRFDDGRFGDSRGPPRGSYRDSERYSDPRYDSRGPPPTRRPPSPYDSRRRFDRSRSPGRSAPHPNPPPYARRPPYDGPRQRPPADPRAYPAPRKDDYYRDRRYPGPGNPPRSPVHQRSYDSAHPPYEYRDRPRYDRTFDRDDQRFRARPGPPFPGHNSRGRPMDIDRSPPHPPPSSSHPPHPYMRPNNSERSPPRRY